MHSHFEESIIKCKHLISFWFADTDLVENHHEIVGSGGGGGDDGNVDDDVRKHIPNGGDNTL